MDWICVRMPRGSRENLLASIEDYIARTRAARQWCRENFGAAELDPDCTDTTFLRWTHDGSLEFRFKHERDATAFALRWG